MKLANEWKEYKILDMANGQKLEKWGDVILSRPDPQIIWKNQSYPQSGGIFIHTTWKKQMAFLRGKRVINKVIHIIHKNSGGFRGYFFV